MEVCHRHCEPWRVTLVDTGDETMTGGRLRRVRDYLDDETFCFTYGDGLADVDIGALIAFHRQQKVKATLTAVQPPGRFGALDIDGDRIRVSRKSRRATAAGSTAASSCSSPKCSSTSRATRRRGSAGRWSRWRATASSRPSRHRGFWQPMDTLRDKLYLEDLWQSGEAPWKVWA